MSSSRKLAVPKVATYRILTQLGEYRGWFEGAGAGRRGACSGLSTPCMSMQNLAVVVQGCRRAGFRILYSRKVGFLRHQFSVLRTYQTVFL